MTNTHTHTHAHTHTNNLYTHRNIPESHELWPRWDLRWFLDFHQLYDGYEYLLAEPVMAHILWKCLSKIKSVVTKCLQAVALMVVYKLHNKIYNTSYKLLYTNHRFCLK